MLNYLYGKIIICSILVKQQLISANVVQFKQTQKQSDQNPSNKSNVVYNINVQTEPVIMNLTAEPYQISFGIEQIRMSASNEQEKKKQSFCDSTMSCKIANLAVVISDHTF